MRGEGRIFQKPGSRFWYMAYYLDGQEIREKTGASDPERAGEKLRKRLEAIRAGDAAPRDHRVRLGDLCRLLREDYALREHRSAKTLAYPLGHLLDFFDPHRNRARCRCGALTVKRISTAALGDYVAHRRLKEGAAVASINMELALLGRAFKLAVAKELLGVKAIPTLPKLEPDASRIRQGFFTRDEVETLGGQLPEDLTDVVRFLFFSAWRIGEARTLEWRDYDRATGTLRLRPEHSKNKHSRVLPVDAGELAAILNRRLEKRRLECSFIFHRDGQPIGDFRKVWTRACTAIGLAGRIVHDLRRSGVKHLIEAGNDPHTVMAFSGHRTDSMLKRYHIVDLDALRAAADRGAAYTGNGRQVAVLSGRQGANTDKRRTKGSGVAHPGVRG